MQKKLKMGSNSSYLTYKIQTFSILLIIISFLYGCSNKEKKSVLLDEKLIYLNNKLNNKLEQLIISQDSLTIILVGDKGCNACVNISYDRLYTKNLLSKTKKTILVFPEYYLNKVSNIPENILTDSVSIVKKTNFLSYLTLIKVKYKKIQEIKHLEYDDINNLTL